MSVEQLNRLPKRVRTPATYHPTDPYKQLRAESARTCTVMTLDDAEVRRFVCALDTPAFAALLVLLSKLKPDGTADTSVTEIAQIARADVRWIRRGVEKLALHNIAQRRKIGSFWINPQYFTVLHVPALSD